MCGICGVLSLNGKQPSEGTLAGMVGTLRHRGPDDSGWAVSGPCGLGSTRLAVIDLSQAGHQPMHVAHKPINVPLRDSGGPISAWIAYNGEVYNFGEVRAALQAMRHPFTSQTDTETLLRAYIQYGAPNFIKPFRGMFALAIWDETAHKLTLLRDRLGKKPLYYTIRDGWLVFGSEIKALLAHPAVPRRLHAELLPHYLAYGYLPTPETLFDGIKVLPPGHMLQVDLRADVPEVVIRPYWEPPFPTERDDPRTEEDISADLLAHLRWAVQLRMIADVPVGAFLSGGVDSAAIVALMAQESSQQVRTFSIGFENEPSFDETFYARKVAARFVTDHHEFIVKPQVIDLVHDLVTAHDHPFGDSSAIPTYLVSKLAREHVTVVLTGDGGDELFAGYNRFRAAQYVQMLANLPPLAQKAITRTLDALPKGTGYGGPIKQTGRLLRAVGQPISSGYLGWVRYISAEHVSHLLGTAAEEAVQAHYAGCLRATPGQALLPHLLDVNLRTYLPDDLLVKVDRCSMANSLEARSPFLDHHLVQFAAAIPLNFKLKGSTSKYILKQALRGLLPDSILGRKKHGFGVPVGAWFRGELAGYVRGTLLSERALRRGLLDAEGVKTMVSLHQAGKADLGHALWTLLTLELWMQQYLD